MTVVAPHFSASLTILAKGTVVVEQDSTEDLIARAKNVAVCPVGFREDNPEYGVPNLLFKTVPLELQGMQADIAKWAGLDLTISEHGKALEEATRIINVEVSGL